MIKERQLEGIALAKKAGVYKGRKSTMSESQVQTIRDRVAAGENKSALAREFGITRQTVCNLVAAE
jgi:DNA invertase Pin-like site-specific DNA recombinase